jgi:glucokinase
VILAGDVGGTKTHLALFEVDAAGVPRRGREETFRSADFPDLATLVARFLAAGGEGEARAVRSAAFGVPGPVAGDRLVAPLPNLEPWGRIDGTAPLPLPGLGVDLPPFGLLNDLVATALGIPLLAPEEVVTLHPGEAEAVGNQVLLAPGTGLGMAFLPWLDGSRHVVPSEGGHMDFSPRNEEEAGLLFHLRRALRRPGEDELRRVSVERVVSGPGLLHIYQFLTGGAGRLASPEVEEALAAGHDPVPVISEQGIDGSCPSCRQAVDLLASLYGAVAGNLALIGTAAGGVYLGGGVTPKILPRLEAGGFLAAFFDKGRLEGYLRRIPVRVVLNSGTALLGAARFAARRLA